MRTTNGIALTLGALAMASSPILAFAPGSVDTRRMFRMPLHSSNRDMNINTRSNYLSKTPTRILMEQDQSSTRLLAKEANGDGEIDYSKLKPKVYPQRWVQLGYLSALALISDWICFSVAAAPSTFEAAYVGHSAASLIDIFLFTNVASCFLVTDTVSKFGLEKSIKGASILMAVGCLFRSGFSAIGPLLGMLGLGAGTAAAAAASSGADLVPYWSLLTGTIMVGASQPFFQCTPPMLSATWFGSDERATSTAVALNFNQIGIATAFLVGGEMATSADGLANYFGVISAMCVAVTMGTILQFENKPPSPPSR